MSKAKKTISMFLAIVMILSLAPASVIASAVNEIVTGEGAPGVVVTSAGIITSVANDPFVVDTEGTTEVIRVAQNPSNSMKYGTAVVPKATPSGIPEVPSGTFRQIAYAGETPQQARAVINFRNGIFPNEEPVVTSSLGQNLLITPAGSEVNGDTKSYFYNISNGTANAGDSVIYTFTYQINGSEYKTYAASHFENILRPNGLLAVAYRSKYDWKAVKTYKTHVSALVLLQGKNMYPGWVTNEGAESRGYIDFASGSVMDGGAVAGCGSSGFKSEADGGYGIADNTNGTVRRFYSGDAEGDANYYKGHAYDKNRPLTKIYIDRGEGENLSTLNARITWQSAEKNDCNFAYLQDLGVWKATTDPGGLTSSSGFNYNTGSGDGVISIPTRNQTGEGYMMRPADVEAGTFATFPLQGTGNSGDIYTLGTSTQGQLDNPSKTNRWVVIHAPIASVQFINYDASNLRAQILAIDNNTGVTYNGQTYYRGQLPSPDKFTAGYPAFQAARENALKCLAAPDEVLGIGDKWTEVNTCFNALAEAYFGLQGYRPNVNYTVNYVISGSNVAILPQRTGVVNTTDTFMTTAPVIQGYRLAESTNSTSQYVDGTEDITVTYRYEPMNYSLVLTTNNDAQEQVTISCEYNSELPISEMNSQKGTKEFYDFVGWYYDEQFTNPVQAGDLMPANALPVYAKWVPSPLHINFDPLIPGQAPIELGTVTPDTDVNVAVYFERPATDHEFYGYNFVNYYADENLETLVTWPLEFHIGDSDITIYGRYEEVHGNISFESNGGTPVDSISFSPNEPISQPPAPTRQGYDFAGWYYDRDLTNHIAGWTELIYNEDLEVIGSAPVEGGTITKEDFNGFVAYAKWKPQIHSISFETGVNYVAEPSKFNTRNEALVTIEGPADSAVSAEDLASIVIPSRFGYEFVNWSYNGRRYDIRNYPTEDITLTAQWIRVDYSAFIDVLPYKLLGGQPISVNNKDYDSQTIQDKPEVMRGDIITFRMSSKTNFYTGSSLFVFMYDKNFYEPIAEGKAEFKLNPESDYISGLGVLDAANPTYSAVTNSDLLRWPDGIDRTRFAAMQIAIDPNVTPTNYDTEPMNDEKWILEFKLRVKDNATGTGEVFMSNDWTRTPENPMGTMFYGWSRNKTSVLETTNNVVVPNLTYTFSEVTVGDATPVMTTVTVNSGAGAFPDGSTTNTYTGRANTEILDYVGTPTRYGYHLVEGQEFLDADGNVWIEGYYPPEETPTKEYTANWALNEHKAEFYSKDTTLTKTVDTLYGQPVTGIPTIGNILGYTFGGWKDESGNPVDFETYTCPDADVKFYAIWVPARNTYSINYMYEGSKIYTQKFNNCVTANIIAVVDEVPEVEEPNTVYVVASTISKKVDNVGSFGYDPDNNTLPLTVVVAPNGTSSININVKRVPVQDRFVAISGTFASNGTNSIYHSGLETSTYREAGIEEIEVPVRTGYNFVQFQSGSTIWSPDVYFTGKTYTAKWTEKEFVVEFLVNGSSVKRIENQKYNSNISAPAEPNVPGYTFKGWKIQGADDSTATKNIGKLDTEGNRTYEAVLEAKNYEVKYTVDGVQIGTTQQYAFNTVQTYNAYPEARFGYTFNGWYFNGGDESHAPGTTYTIPAENVVISGTFVANQYPVRFNANGGKFGEADYVDIMTTFDTNIILPESNPTKSGYEFKGWALTPDATDFIAPNDFGTLTTEGATYYAVWAASNATYYVDIYYMGVNGEYGEAERTIELTGLVDTVAEYTSTPEVTGFTFDSANSVLSGTVPAPDAGTLRLTVKYSRNTHDIYAKNDDAAAPVKVAENIYFGAPISEPADPDASFKPGYTFTGWTWDGIYETMPDNDITATAQWSICQYDVKFYLTQEAFNEGAEPVNASKPDYGTVIARATAIREGYTLVGWAREGTTELVVFDENLTVSIGGDTFVGIWQINSYPLYYRSNGSVIATYSVEYGTPVESFPKPDNSEIPPREGWLFNGWNYGSTTTMPAIEDGIFVNAVWERELYTVSFNANGGSPDPESFTAYAGDDISVNIPAQPVKEGYTFKYWYEGEDSSTAFEFTVMPARSIQLNAFYQANNYNVKFYDGNGGVISNNAYVFGTSVTEIVIPEEGNNPVKEFYTFEGWTAIEGGSADASDAFDFSNAELTVGTAGYNFYPIFVKIPVELIPKGQSTAVIISNTYPDAGFIFGLEVKLTEEKLLEQYLTFNGSGEIRVLPSFINGSVRICGTGTKVELLDVETTQVVAIYYIVVYGDVNGDGTVTSVDVANVKREAARADKSWLTSNPIDVCKMKAVDVNGNGIIESGEITALTKVSFAVLVYVQTTGETKKRED